MRRIGIALSLIVALGALIGWGRGQLGTAAQEAPGGATTTHPFVGTWVVDTVIATDTDPPEIAIVTPDGRLAGLGANRVAGGTWEAVDAQTAMLTLVTVFDSADGAGYVIVRGPHTVDASGETWECACTFTVVAADGTVLDKGDAPASARRLPLEGPEFMGSPLDVVPTWTSALAAATPAP